MQRESEEASEACSSWHISTATNTHGTAFRSGCHVAMMNDDIRDNAFERVLVLSDLFPSGVTLIGIKHGMPPFKADYKQGRAAGSLESTMSCGSRRV